MVLIIHDGEGVVHVALEYHRISTIRKIRELIAVKPMTVQELKKDFGLREIPMSTINTNDGIVL